MDLHERNSQLSSTAFPKKKFKSSPSLALSLFLLVTLLQSFETPWYFSSEFAKRKSNSHVKYLLYYSYNLFIFISIRYLYNIICVLVFLVSSSTFREKMKKIFQFPLYTFSPFWFFFWRIFDSWPDRGRAADIRSSRCVLIFGCFHFENFLDKCV